jgi:DNA-binding PadR family transcriptional regulator
MKKQETIGQFEQLILAAVSTLDEAYGITIHQEAEKLGQRPLKLGAVYATLDRLEDKGYLRSWMTEATPERGGRPKRCYQIEKKGKAVLKESTETAIRIHEAVERTGLWKPKANKT